MYNNEKKIIRGDQGLMFNNINDNNTYNSHLGNASNVINLNAIRTNLQKSGYSTNPYVDKTEISSNAMELFQRDLDINKFNKIAMSDSEDTSHLEKMKELFNDGVVDVYEDDVLSELVTNSKLLDDLEL